MLAYKIAHWFVSVGDSLLVVRCQCLSSKVLLPVLWRSYTLCWILHGKTNQEVIFPHRGHLNAVRRHWVIQSILSSYNWNIHFGWSRPVISKLRPWGQMWPFACLYPALGALFHPQLTLMMGHHSSIDTSGGWSTILPQIPMKG